MTTEKDITGQRFGRLTALRKHHSEWNKEKEFHGTFGYSSVIVAKKKLLINILY